MHIQPRADEGIESTVDQIYKAGKQQPDHEGQKIKLDANDAHHNGQLVGQEGHSQPFDANGLLGIVLWNEVKAATLDYSGDVTPGCRFRGLGRICHQLFLKWGDKEGSG